MGLAQGHNTGMLVRLESVALWHSTTDHLRSRVDPDQLASSLINWLKKLADKDMYCFP